MDSEEAEGQSEEFKEDEGKEEELKKIKAGPKDSGGFVDTEERGTAVEEEQSGPTDAKDAPQRPQILCVYPTDLDFSVMPFLFFFHRGVKPSEMIFPEILNICFCFTIQINPIFIE